MIDKIASSPVMDFVPAVDIYIPFFGQIGLQTVVLAVLIFSAITLAFWFLRIVVLLRVKSLAGKTDNKFDDTIVEIISGVRAWVYTLIALYVSLQLFNLPVTVDKALDAIFYFVVVWQAIEAVTSLVRYFTTTFIEKDEDGDGQVDPNTANVSHLVSLIAKIGLWSLGLLFILSNLGIEVTSLLAGLGIGGLAVAFALQGVLSDLFASFSIYFDRPFRIGDYIVVGSDSGTVEKIGIKTTRIRTLQGEELVISNAELTTARVQNFKKMEERRIVSEFGITYETPQDKVKEVNGIVGRIFDAIDGVRMDRVHFTTFGDSALIFEVVYYTESSDYSEYLNAQQSFNFELMEKFAELNIEFAYPTQVIYTKTV